MKKKAFLLKDASPKKHLYFVITDPDQDNRVLIVNITSCKRKIHYNNICILLAKENHHSFITKDSFVHYRKAQEINFLMFLKLQKENKLILKNDISNKLLLIIQDGAKNKKSDLPSKFKKYFDFF